MRKISFYIQTRADGGRRIGIEVDGDTVFGRFEPGTWESDPGLVWYVDIRCRGDNLPDKPDAVKQWLLSRGELLTEELRALSEKLRTGLDAGLWPLQSKVSAAPTGVEMVIVCSSIRGIASRQYGEILAELASNFVSMLNSLSRLDAVA